MTAEQPHDRRNSTWATSMRRRAAITIGAEQIAAMIGLPDGLTIVGVHPDPRLNAIVLIVTGPELDEVPDGSMAPDFPGDGAFNRAVAYDAHRRPYYRWEWQAG